MLFEEIDEMEILEKILHDERVYEMIRRLLPDESGTQKAAWLKIEILYD